MGNKNLLPSTRFELMISALLVLRLTTWPRRQFAGKKENVGTAMWNVGEKTRENPQKTTYLRCFGLDLGHTDRVSHIKVSNPVLERRYTVWTTLDAVRSRVSVPEDAFGRKKKLQRCIKDASEMHVVWVCQKIKREERETYVNHLPGVKVVDWRMGSYEYHYKNLGYLTYHTAGYTSSSPYTCIPHFQWHTVTILILHLDSGDLVN